MSTLTNVTPTAKINIPNGEAMIIKRGTWEASRNVRLEGLNSHSLAMTVAVSVLRGEVAMTEARCTATGDGAFLVLDCAPDAMGWHVLQPGEELFLKKGALLARDENVALESTTNKICKTVTEKFTNQSDKSARVFFQVQTGVITELKINRDEGAVQVDTGNVVGYTGASLEVRVTQMNDFFAALQTGEHSQVEFKGTGSIFLRQGGLKLEKISKEVEDLSSHTTKPSQSKECAQQ